MVWKTVGEESAVTYLRMGHNEWFATDEFPPATEGMTSLYLADQGLLKAKSSSESDASAAFDFDPDDPSPTLGGMNSFIGVDPNYKKVGAGPRDQRPIEKRDDCLVFTSDVLTSDVVLEGNAIARLFARQTVWIRTWRCD